MIVINLVLISDEYTLQCARLVVLKIITVNVSFNFEQTDYDSYKKNLLTSCGTRYFSVFCSPPMNLDRKFLISIYIYHNVRN